MYKQSQLAPQGRNRRQISEISPPQKMKQPLTECSLSLLYVIFNSHGHLQHRFCSVVEDCRVHLFSKVPEGVYHHIIELSSLCSRRFACGLLPPSYDLQGVSLLLPSSPSKPAPSLLFREK
jgi:hypothetical protein